MVHYSSGRFPLYIVTEHPKSGGSWFSQILGDYLDVPFPRNQIPPLNSCIMHGHYGYAPRINNPFVIVRDGRDVMISWYYHCFFINDRYNERLVQRMRQALPFSNYDNIEKNLPDFMRYHFEKCKPLGFHWGAFVDNWYGKVPYLVLYERMLADPYAEVSMAIKKVLNVEVNEEKLAGAISKFSFEKLSGRHQGEEKKSSFLRKGIAGDWKNHFSWESKTIFHKYAGDKLVLLGYEPDDSWVLQDRPSCMTNGIKIASEIE